MNNVARNLLKEAVKVGLAAWGTVSAGPFLEKALPDAPGIVLYLILAIVTAGALEAIYTFVLGRPTIIVRWIAHDHSEENGTLALGCSPVRPNSKQLDLRVRAGRSGWLGNELLRRAVDKGLEIQISFLHAEGRFTIEDGRGRPRVTNLVEADSEGMLVFRLTGTPDVNRWSHARVHYEADTFPSGEFTVSHALVTPRGHGYFYGKVIKIDSIVKKAQL